MVQASTVQHPLSGTSTRKNPASPPLSVRAPDVFASLSTTSTLFDTVAISWCERVRKARAEVPPQLHVAYPCEAMVHTSVAVVSYVSDSLPVKNNKKGEYVAARFEPIYSLLTTHYLLLTTYYSLLTTYYLLLTTHY
jgi:hypothetical protein